MAVLTDYDISCLQHKDRPDLQDVCHSVGIEVVEDCYPLERKHERFIKEVLYCPVNQIPKKQLDGFIREGGSIREENNRIVSAGLGETKANNPQHLIETICKKIRLLNSGGYTIFKSNRLYVFVDTVLSLFDSYVASIIDEVGKCDGKYSFDTIYLFGWYEFVICDMSHKTFERKDVTPEIRSKIKNLM